MTPEQSRAARGWLGWSQGELAKRANVSLSTVHDFERGLRTPTANNLASMRRAIETAGILFLFGETGEAAGLIRKSADDDPCAFILEKKGSHAGILRPHEGGKPIA
jgi:transcriptional regulator with XRE-family HTH domain